MCRNIKTLFNLEPRATDEEIREASLQFVRKLSGFNTPSKANEAAFRRAVDEVAASSRKLLDSLVTSAEPRDREVAAERARARAAVRFGSRREYDGASRFPNWGFPSTEPTRPDAVGGVERAP